MKEKDITFLNEKKEPKKDTFSLLDQLVKERYPEKSKESAQEILFGKRTATPKETARDILFGSLKEVPPLARPVPRREVRVLKKEQPSPKKTLDTAAGVILVASLLSLTPPGRELVARGREEVYQHVSMDEREHSLTDTLEDELGVREVMHTTHASGVASPLERSALLKESYTPKIYPDNHFALSEAEMRRSCEELPRGLRQNIDSVSYEHRFIKMPDVYGMSGYEAAHCSGRDITFSRGSDTAPKTEMIQILKHEAGHAADWDTNKLLTRFERLSLLQAVLERVKSPERYKSAYVEQINNKDRGQELSAKCKEYFAEIIQVYLSPSYVFLPREDVSICEDFFSKTDPGFDIWGARGLSAPVPQVRKKGRREFGQLF